MRLAGAESISHRDITHEISADDRIEVKNLAEPAAAANGLGRHADCGAAVAPVGGTWLVLNRSA